jgi:hypothetical protein
MPTLKRTLTAARAKSGSAIVAVGVPFAKKRTPVPLKKMPHSQSEGTTSTNARSMSSRQHATCAFGNGAGARRL